MSREGALYCAFTNGCGLAHRDPDGQLRCAEAAIEDNPQNEPSPTALSTTADLLASITNLPDSDIERAALILSVDRKWKNGRTIKVGFIDGPDWARKQVMEIGSRWTRYANLHFVETPAPEAEIRITFREGGSWSMMGNGALGVRTGPTMQLGWYVNHPGDAVVLHEFGHLLAFPHEQFHPERDCQYNRANVINDLSGPPNNWSVQQIEFNVLRPPWSGDTFTKYNPKSIMHYAQPAHWFYDPSCAVGPNNTLSRLDKKGAAMWYPKPGIETALDAMVGGLDTLRSLG